MKENIILNETPHNSGVYLFISNDEVIYIGSSKDLHKRMIKHRVAIKKGSDHGYKQDLYQFLQSNQFTVEYQLSDNYRQLEQELIEKHQPKYNSHRAFTGLGTKTGREAEYMKEYDKKYKEQHKQLCNYNGETLTLAALSMRLKRSGISNPVIEAKKFLINKDNI